MTSDLALNELQSNDNTFGDHFDNHLKEELNDNNSNIDINNSLNREQLNDNQLSSTLLSPINSSQSLSSPNIESKQTQNSFNNLINNKNSNKILLLNELNENNNNCNEIISDNNINNNNLLIINLNVNNNKQIKRIELDEKELMSLNVNELRHYWTQQQLYINSIESQLKQFNRDKCDLISLRESEEKLKQQQLEANRRENILVMRLTTKEQEMQEYLVFNYYLLTIFLLSHVFVFYFVFYLSAVESYFHFYL
jgi:hypothetical protein